jgi:hypothetical protein
MGTRWRGLLAPLGITTGDGRRFSKTKGAVTWRELPLGLKWQRNDDMGHDDSVIVGSVDEINIGTVTQALDKGWITEDGVSRLDFPHDTLAVWGTGELFDDVDASVLPRLAEDVAEARLLTERQVIGPSVDAGAASAVLAEPGSDEPVSEERLEEIFEEAWENGTEVELEVLFTEYQIAAATLVNIPAFQQCLPFTLEPVDDEAEAAALVASVRATGWTDYPLASLETGWNAATALRHLAEHFALDGDEPDWAGFSGGFLWRDDDANPDTRGAYGYGLVDVVDGQLAIVPKAAFTAAKSLSEGGTSKAPVTEQTRMREVLAGIYTRMAAEFDDPGITVPWDATITAAVQARTERAVSLIASAAPITEADRFADPELAAVTPITITDSDDAGVRRVFGHVAAFGVCHAGIRDVCTTAPTSASQYASFHRYTTTAAGHDLPVPVGRITVAHGSLTAACRCCPGIDDHACNRLALGATIAHYDKAQPVAYVRAGEDKFGIWVAGIIAPEASDQDVAALARQKVSGDWRETAGHLELVEVLTLNREKPGFPLPRAAMANGRQMSLVAAGTVAATRSGVRPRPTPARRATGEVFDYDKMAAAMTRALAPILPPGTTVAYDTTPVVDVDPAVLHATDAATDHAATAAAIAAELDGTLYSVDAATAAADLERITAGV